MTKKDNMGDDIQKFCQRLKMLRTPKSLLKKCRYCNSKKRSCTLDLSSCLARQRTCSVCHKKGHCPKSVCCKAKQKRAKRIKMKLEKKPAICVEMHLMLIT